MPLLGNGMLFLLEPHLGIEHEDSDEDEVLRQRRWKEQHFYMKCGKRKEQHLLCEAYHVSGTPQPH